MNNPTDTPLIERLRRDAILCRAESFHSTAELLDEASDALTAANARIRDLERVLAHERAMYQNGSSKPPTSEGG